MSPARPLLLCPALLLACVLVSGCGGAASGPGGPADTASGPVDAAAADESQPAPGDAGPADGAAASDVPGAADPDARPADSADHDGTPAAPPLTVAPDALDFGAVAVGATETRTLAVRNDAPDGPPVALRSVVAEAGTSADFHVGPPDRASLGPGETAAVVVTYGPRDALADAGAVVVSYDGPGSPIRVPLRAEAQAPAVCFRPEIIEFGEIPPGREAAFQFALAGCGTLDTAVVDLALSPASSADFALEDAPPLPLTLAPGAETFVGLRYRPTGANADHGSVVATFRLPDGGSAHATVAVSGSEPATGAPLLAVRPATVHFEGVLLGTPQTRTVTLANEGGAALALHSVALSEGSHAALALEDAPVPGSLVAAGAERAFRVVFAPDAPFPHDDAPIGTIVVRSNDPQAAAAGGTAVPVLATSGAPHLGVVPDGPVDFGTVGQRQTVTAGVTLRNVGGARLELRSARITPDDATWGDEFRIDAPPPLDPPTAGGLGSLGPGQTAALGLSFTNNGPDHGAAGATLTIETDDPEQPTRTVRLVAERALDPTLPPSGVTLEPSTLDLGAVAPDGEARGVVSVRNLSTGERRVMAARVGACASYGSGWSSRLACDPDVPLAAFALATPIPPAGLVVPAGQALPLEIVYRPDEPPAAPDGVTRSRAALQLDVQDPAAGPGGWYELPEPDDEGLLAPNLEARCGWPDGIAWPPVVEFGEVPVDCVGEATLSVTATRPVPLRVLTVEPAPDCGATFTLGDPPALPPEGLVATDAAPATLRLRFSPPQLGEHGCTLGVGTDDAGDPRYEIPLTGTGVEGRRIEDVFVHRDAPPVDVLFVVDDSGSMCEEQDRLAANLEAFIADALTWGNDFRIGVVDTCVNDEQRCEGVGALRTEHPPARWVTPATWTDFLDNVRVGCWGPGDQEAGLQAAWRALTPPVATGSDVPCGGDGDCPAPWRCLADLGRCGGASAEFLREDAALEIAILSDEEDQSDQPPGFYVSYFLSLRNRGKGGARVHAIVGDEHTGCTGGGTFAAAGDRYVEAARATRGIVASICDDSFAAPLHAMGELAFGTRWTYPLSQPADPESLLVTVAGHACLDGWSYVEGDNAIEFLPGGPCTPLDGDPISVKYERRCTPLGP